LIGFPLIHHDTVAGFDGLVSLQGESIPVPFLDSSEKDPAFLSKASMDEFLIVDALKPTGVQTA